MPSKRIPRRRAQDELDRDRVDESLLPAGDEPARKLETKACRWGCAEKVRAGERALVLTDAGEKWAHPECEAMQEAKR